MRTFVNNIQQAAREINQALDASTKDADKLNYMT
jgi:hypothetical protein